MLMTTKFWTRLSDMTTTSARSQTQPKKWDYVHIHRGGGPEHTSNLLQNHFNKVLQFKVLQRALREFHSGRQMDDYVLAAKKQFLLNMLKVFKFEMVYIILRRKIPKLELVVSSVNDPSRIHQKSIV